VKCVRGLSKLNWIISPFGLLLEKKGTSLGKSLKAGHQKSPGELRYQSEGTEEKREAFAVVLLSSSVSFLAVDQPSRRVEWIDKRMAGAKAWHFIGQVGQRWIKI